MILEKNYSTMCAEVLEILKYCPQSDIDKIPQKLIKSLEQNKTVNLNVYIDPNKGIFEQDVTNETIIMMFIIFRNWWATEEEKKEIDKILEENDLKYNELYSVENIFKNNSVNIQEEIKNENPETNSENSLVEYHENIITKFVNLIKKIFKRR